MGSKRRPQARPKMPAFIIIIASGLFACSSTPPRAPVSDVRQPPSIRLQEHVVAKGETLYSIAWRYNLDHRKLARVNGIGRNYVIYPGQRLSLDMNRAPPVAAAPPRAEPRAQAAPKRSTSPRPQKPERSQNQTPRRPSPAPAKSRSDPQKWQWPTDGKVVARFQSNGGLNKGIDIASELGEPVIAAAAGEVVYSGSGLRGYGQLVIVKHSEKYLSAYAHNSKLLVKEGEAVRSGQQIAEVGSSGTDSTKLHFEIRYDGKPVDPVKYLPRR